MKKTIKSARKLFFIFVLTIIFITLCFLAVGVITEVFIQKKSDVSKKVENLTPIAFAQESEVVEESVDVVEEETGVFQTGKEDVEPGLLYVRIVKGCLYTPYNKGCLYVRSGPSSKHVGFYSIQIDALFEVKEVIVNDEDEIW